MTHDPHTAPDVPTVTTAAKATKPQPVLCEPCSGIQQNWRRAPGHAELVQGTNRKVDRGQGQATITASLGVPGLLHVNVTGVGVGTIFIRWTATVQTTEVAY